MWLITTRGFYSVVADTTDPTGDTVLIRAQLRDDLENLADLLPSIEISETPDHDYRFRTTALKDAVAEIARSLASEIDYPNSKNAVAERQGTARARAYGNAWAELLRLQQRAPGL